MRRNNIDRQQHRDGARLNRRCRRAVAVLTAAALVLAGITSGVYGVSVRATETTSSDLQSSSDIYIEEDVSAAASAASVSSDGGTDSSSSSDSSETTADISSAAASAASVDLLADAVPVTPDTEIALDDTSDTSSDDTDGSGASGSSSDVSDLTADESADAQESDAEETTDGDSAEDDEAATDGDSTEDDEATEDGGSAEDAESEEDEDSEDGESDGDEDLEEDDEELEEDELEEDELEEEELEEDEENPAEEIELEGVTDSTTGLTVSVSGSRAALNGAETIRVTSVDSTTAENYENLLNDAVGASGSEDGSEEDGTDSDSDSDADGEAEAEASDEDGEIQTLTSYTFHAVLSIELLDENDEVVQPKGAVTVTLSGDAIKTWRAADGTFGVLHIVTEESSTGNDSGNDSGDADSAEDADEEDLSDILTEAEVGESIEADGVTFVSMIVETISSTSVSFETDSFSPYALDSELTTAAEGDEDSVVRYTTDSGAADSIGTDSEENLEWIYEDSLQDAADAIADAAGTDDTTVTGVIQLLCDIECDAEDAAMGSGNSGTDSDESYSGYRDITLHSGTDITLDLNGCTITGSGIGSVLVVEGNLTLMDSTASGPSKVENPSETLSGVVDSDGTAVYSVDSDGTVTFTPLTLAGETTDSRTSRTVYYSSAEIDETTYDVTITYYTYTAGAITGGEQGICIEGGKLYMQGGIIAGNSGNGYGGGIYIKGDEDGNGETSFEMTGGAVADNTGEQGGGIYAEYCNIELCGGVVSGNYGNNGGGGIVTDCSALKISGCVVSGNSAVTTVSTDSTGTIQYYNCGGGIYGYCSEILINDGVISSNTADGGAGIFIDGVGSNGNSDSSDGKLVISGGLIACNTANRMAGIFVVCCLVEIKGGFVAGNEALYADGGGIGCYVSDNNSDVRFGLFISGGVIAGNSAGISSGGVYAGHYVDVTISGGIVSKNIAEYGGGIYCNYYTTFTMTDGTISYNETTDGGAGLYLYGSNSDSEKAKISGGAICGNEADTSGGGVYIYKYSTILIGGTISGNVSNATNDGGGGLRVNDATVIMSGGVISDNTAHSGAGMYIGNSSVFTATGGTVGDNTSTNAGSSGNGGGIFLTASSTMIMDGLEISNNEAELWGGGLYVTGAATTCTILSGTITGNTAETNCGNYTGGGGGIRVQSGTLTMYGGTVSGNKASKYYGGGVCVNNSSSAAGVFYFYGGEISENSAATYGGGIYCIGTLTMSGGSNTVTYKDADGETIKESVSGTGGTVSGNTAPSGGGVYSTNTFTFSSGSITSNTASSGNGGGVYSNGTLNLSGGSISSNTAAGNGGGIYSSGTVTMSGGTIGGLSSATSLPSSLGNTAVNGAGVYMNSGTMTMSGGMITGNAAGSYGSDGILGVGSTESTGGTGGGVYVASGTFTMETGSSSSSEEGSSSAEEGTGSSGDEDVDTDTSQSTSAVPILANNTAGLAAADLYSASTGTTVTLIDWGSASSVTYLFDGEEYSIDGWYKDSEGDRYADQEMDGHTAVTGTALASNTTGLSVVAAWALYYLLYYANYTGNRSFDESLHTGGETITVSDYSSLFTESRTGYSFVGWNTEKDGTGTWYYPSSFSSGDSEDDGDDAENSADAVYNSFELTASTYLYAQWLQTAPTGIEADTAPYVWMVVFALAGAAGLVILQLQRRRRWE